MSPKAQKKTLFPVIWMMLYFLFVAVSPVLSDDHKELKHHL